MKQIRDRYTETYGPSTTCICPRCGKKHDMKLLWIGRGAPRKFCPSCKPMQEVFGAAVEQNTSWKIAIRQSIAQAGGR
jgi:transposase